MIDPSLALQTAVRLRLTAFPGLAGADILDRTALPPRLPSIVIGEGQTVLEDGALARDLSRVYLDVHCWSLDDSMAAAKRTTGLIRDALRDGSPWSVEDHHLVDFRIQATRYLRDHEGEQPLAHAVLMINALVQEAAPS